MLMLKTLSSSSRGNCHILEDDECSIMLDCGIKAAQILSNIDVKKLKGVFVTHKHSL